MFERSTTHRQTEPQQCYYTCPLCNILHGDNQAHACLKSIIHKGFIVQIVDSEGTILTLNLFSARVCEIHQQFYCFLEEQFKGGNLLPEHVCMKSITNSKGSMKNFKKRGPIYLLWTYSQHTCVWNLLPTQRVCCRMVWESEEHDRSTGHHWFLRPCKDTSIQTD